MNFIEGLRDDVTQAASGRNLLYCCYRDWEPSAVLPYWPPYCV